MKHCARTVKAKLVSETPSQTGRRSRSMILDLLVQLRCFMVLMTPLPSIQQSQQQRNQIAQARRKHGKLTAHIVRVKNTS